MTEVPVILCDEWTEAQVKAFRLMVHRRGLEIDPKYVDVIVRRWQNLTGEQATLDLVGATFAEVQSGRQAEERGKDAESPSR